MNIISKNFELRYISGDTKANGETDFKGETSVLDTEQRIDFLNEYARAMKDILGDVSLDTEIVTLTESKERLGKIKPQPVPQKRRRIILDTWKHIGFGGVKRNVGLKNGRIETQDFRCLIEWELTETVGCRCCRFAMGDAAVMEFDSDGIPYYIADKTRYEVAGGRGVYKIKFELDFVCRKWNLYLNDELAADFVDFSDPEVSSVSEFSSPYAKCMIKSIRGVGYHRLTESLFEPYSVSTFIDENFEGQININGWDSEEYNDAAWSIGKLPIVHGGERFAGQDMYMRKNVFIDHVPEYAELYIESLTPGGEVYINGRLAALINDPSAHKIDVTDHLREGENLFAVRVYSDKIKDRDKMTHTNMDLYTGWFAGRMHLDLLPPIYIDDVFAWTESIEDGKATERVRVSVKTQRGLASAKAAEHKITANIMPWFPEEGETCASAEWTTPATPNISEITEGVLEVTDPLLWTADKPRLYKITVSLTDPSGSIVDDYAVTVGIRTVSQEGGVFRINGKPELLRAPLLFGSRPPLDKIAAWEKCPPAEYYVQEMLMVKRMNGNGLRMSVHDERMGGINDPRICELADQLGSSAGRLRIITLLREADIWLYGKARIS